MIVKILQKSTNFAGVRYSSNKVMNGNGELMLVKNFGALQGLEHLKPNDYINYLEAVSARSGKIKYPQLHVAISCKGHSHNKDELTAIAEKWMNGMGYGQHPYLVINHSDTNNNHIHIVSTRVGKDGKKLSDSFERIKANNVLKSILGLHKALTYNFSTRAQFMMIIEAGGGSVVKVENTYHIFKEGKMVEEVLVAEVDKRIAAYIKDVGRIKQIHALIEKYMLKYDSAIYTVNKEQSGKEPTVATIYSSELADFLYKSFGVQVKFHSTTAKQPYGYTFIDHAGLNVFKGGEIMDIKNFISQQTLDGADIPHEPNIEDPNVAVLAKNTITVSEAHNSGAELLQDEQFVSGVNEASEVETYSEESNFNDDVTQVVVLQIDIADDIDDEAINGRNRRRKKKARTNSR